MEDTIIKVGVARQDEYGNLFVTPEGGGKEVKISEKRKNLHPLFQQGNTVSLHWEVFKNVPYVKDAKQIVGEPAPNKIDTGKTPVPLQREPFISDPSRNASIEAQTAYGKIMDNWEKDIPQSMKDAAVHWGLSKLNFKELPATIKAPEKPVDKPLNKAQDRESVEPALEKAVADIVESPSPIVAEIQGLLDAVNWKPATWRSWIKMQCKGVDTTGTLAEVIARMNPNQVNLFVNHLKAMKESAGR